MDKKSYLLLRDAVELALLYLPLLFISEGIAKAYPFDTSACYIIAVLILPLVSALLCFFVLISENPKTALKKWGLSVPFTLAFYAFLYFSDFRVRLINTLYPGYGRESAGGGFAFMVTFFAFSIFQIFGNLLAAGMSGRIENRAQKLRRVTQNMIVPTICAVILVSVLYLHLTMPTWEAIYQSVYG